jgi:hypothetical protein
MEHFNSDTLLKLYSVRCSVRISATTPINVNASFRTFPQSPHTNSGILPRLRYNRFLPNPFQVVVIYLPSCYSALCSRTMTASVV